MYQFHRRESVCLRRGSGSGLACSFTSGTGPGLLMSSAERSLICFNQSCVIAVFWLNCSPVSTPEMGAPAQIPFNSLAFRLAYSLLYR